MLCPLTRKKISYLFTNAKKKKILHRMKITTPLLKIKLPSHKQKWAWVPEAMNSRFGPHQNSIVNKQAQDPSIVFTWFHCSYKICVQSSQLVKLTIQSFYGSNNLLWLLLIFGNICSRNQQMRLHLYLLFYGQGQESAPETNQCQKETFLTKLNQYKLLAILHSKNNN